MNIMGLLENKKGRVDYGGEGWNSFFFDHGLTVFSGIHICSAGSFTQKSNKKGLPLLLDCRTNETLNR